MGCFVGPFCSMTAFWDPAVGCGVRCSDVSETPTWINMV